MPVIRGIIFDLGRVLVDIDFFRGLLGRIGLEDTAAVMRLAGDEDFVLYSTGKLEPEEFFRKILEKTDLQIDYDEFSRLWCDIFLEMAGMEELVAGLAQKYPLGLLSDTDPLHWAHICEAFPWIGRYFSKPVLSFEQGVMKPDSQAFRAAVDSVGLQAGECLFIDDLPKNIEGAERCGLEGELFTGREALKERLVARGIEI